jgi:hypothetical protein
MMHEMGFSDAMWISSESSHRVSRRSQPVTRSLQPTRTPRGRVSVTRMYVHTDGTERGVLNLNSRRW